MKPHFKISVIVPIYNVKEYIEKSLESIINQTMDLSDIQVILIDDASNDGSQDIADDYARKYDNFQTIHLTENTGSAAIPRNVGIKHASSEYIMFLDPDDEYVEDYCEVMFENITKFNVNGVKCNFITIFDNKEFYNYYFDKSVDEKIIYNDDQPLKLVSTCNGIYKTSFLVENNIMFPNCLGEDICFSINEFLKLDKMVFLNNYFGYKYFNRTDSHAKSPNPQKIKRVFEAFTISRELCLKNNREDVMNVILGQQIIGLFTRIINVDNKNDKITLFKELYELSISMPNLIIPDIRYKIANFLLVNKKFNLTIAYMETINKLNNSKVLLKAFHILKK